MWTDLTYRRDEMFTRFYANTEAGADAWNQMAKEMDGVAAVLNFEARRVIAQLRRAGYTVGKEPKSKQTIEEILAELEG